MKKQTITMFTGKVWLAIGFCILMVMACEDETSLQMQVDRDCTGTYLRQAELDYKVCNPDKIAAFADGQNILATFAITKECQDASTGHFSCKLYHKFEELIFVKDIID